MSHPANPIEIRKSKLRAEVRAKLAAMTDDQRRAGSAAACARLIALEAFQHASIVMLYMPLPREVDLTAAAIACFRAGKTVCVPVVDWARRDMRPVEVTSFDDHVMELDEHGLRKPREEGQPIVPVTIDLVVTPGVAFDVAGRRLGRGGGFFDRFLARVGRSCTTIGLAFEVQVVDSVPAGANDRAVDILVTDRRVTHAGPSQSRH
jgi:5-formyltetrahydrofolate cyclo-ligase